MSINKLNAPVASRIVQIMKDKGLKQNAVAKRAHFSKQQFSGMLLLLKNKLGNQRGK